MAHRQQFVENFHKHGAKLSRRLPLVNTSEYTNHLQPLLWAVVFVCNKKGKAVVDLALLCALGNYNAAPTRTMITKKLSTIDTMEMTMPAVASSFLSPLNLGASRKPSMDKISPTNGMKNAKINPSNANSFCHQFLPTYRFFTDINTFVT